MAVRVRNWLADTKIDRERADLLEQALENVAAEFGFAISSLSIDERREPDRYPEIDVRFIQLPPGVMPFKRKEP